MKAGRREIEWAKTGTHLLRRWDDKGRSQLSPETIKKEVKEASEMYVEVMQADPLTQPKVPLET